MTEFALQEQNWKGSYEREKAFEKIINYAKFLRQPLTLGLFVPVDEEGNVIDNENRYPALQEALNLKLDEDYAKARENVLFEGVKIKHRENYFNLEDEDGTWIRVIKNNTSLKVEDLLKMSSVELTPSALKQIGL